MARRPRSPPDLKRRGPTREQRRKFIIFCEGRNTEPSYFAALRELYRGALISVETEGGAGVPRTLIDRAKERKRALQRSRDTFEHGDEVWAVFGHDDHPSLQQAINDCHTGGVGLGFSNPCFEVWLILHIADFGGLDGRHAVQRHLRSLRPEYDPDGSKTPNCSELIASIEEAEKRAARLRRARSDEGDRFGRPCTTIDDLTRAIRDAAARFRPQGSP